MKQLMVIAGLLFLAGCQTDSVHESSRFKTIIIKSQGEIETLPDMATFHINLECLDKSIKASKSCLVEQSNELNTRLQSFGIKKEDILTTSVDMNKSYTWKNNSNVFEGYRSSTTLFVTVREIDKLDEIYTELLENRYLNLGGMNYSHTQLDSLKNEAYADALEKSGILADKLLDKIPESKKEILKIGNVEIAASLPEESKEEDSNDMEKVAESKNKSIAISKGMVLVTATLYVEYQIR